MADLLFPGVLAAFDGVDFLVGVRGALARRTAFVFGGFMTLFSFTSDSDARLCCKTNTEPHRHVNTNSNMLMTKINSYKLTGHEPTWLAGVSEERKKSFCYESTATSYG